MQTKVKNRTQWRLAERWAQTFTKHNLIHAARLMGPTLLALAFAGTAHAQGTMDFTGAQTLMTTFKGMSPHVPTDLGAPSPPEQFSVGAKSPMHSSRMS